MNLVQDAWIPVMMRDGSHARVSLMDVFKQGESIADLAANPCQRIALMRLLICITQAALDGPADERAWSTCLPLIPEAAKAYLAKWKDKFNLFGKGAFLQVEDLKETHNATADKLDFTLSSGNNATLFDHAATPGGRIPENARCVLNLLVYQNFSTSGKIGITSWDNIDTKNTSEHAPALEGSMIHTLIRGGTLIESIHANLLTKNTILQLPNFGWGNPCWENTLTRNTLESLCSTYLGRLVPVSRAVRCNKGDTAVTLVAGVLYPKLPENRETMATVRQGKDKLMYLPISLDKQPWRELGALLALDQMDGKGGALALPHLRSLKQHESFNIWTGGLTADQAKILDMAEWSFTLPLQLLDSTTLANYQAGVEKANIGEMRLRDAIKSYADLLKSQNVWRSIAQKVFWTELDDLSHILVETVTKEDRSLEDFWNSAIQKAAKTAYEQTCPHETPRQIQAYVRGLKVLQKKEKA